MAKPFKRRDSRYWWISPIIQGVQQPQSTKTTDYQEALEILRRLEGRIVDGLMTANKATIGELCEILERDYKIKNRRSEDDLKRRVKKYIKPLLGDLRASTVNSATISHYIEKRLEAKASPGTINRELAAIKRAYALGRKSGLVVSIPPIEMLPEDNVRQGYFRDDQFRDVLRHANEILKDVLIVAFYTGWRIDSILHLEWSNVDFDGKVVRLRANQTKNRKAATFPLDPFPEVFAALEHRKALSKGFVTPWVFNREGARVISIRKAWEIARKKANVPGRLIHDLRRTAVRNLKSKGWSDTEIMNIVGLKTLSMLIRYSITTEGDILQKAKAMKAANTF
jgi:integrase